MPMLNISDEALAAEKLLYNLCAELQKNIEESANVLKNDFQENQQGLGAHSSIIEYLLQDLNDAANSRTSIAQLRRILRFSIANRETHKNSTFPTKHQNVSPAPTNVAYTAGVIGQIYNEGYRQLRSQSKDGSWNGDTFYPDKTATPSRYNPENRTYGQIIENLETQYGIRYYGTPYKDGCADFSGISIAQVSLADIVDKHVQDGRIKDPLVSSEETDYAKIFSNRERNFRYADEVVAKAQLPIHGLSKGYTADDLAAWRETNRFTWDESYLNGYLLVPAEIHNNISHTGLVGISEHGKEAEKTIINRLKKASKD